MHLRAKLPTDIEYRDFLAPDPDAPEGVNLAPLAMREEPTEASTIPGYDGYILTWNTVDSYGTFFTKGSAKKTIRERGEKAPVLWQHWPDQPIGNHLFIAEDDTGVKVSTRLIEGVAEADKALALMRGGVHLGLSFGFKTVQYRTATEKDDLDFSVAPSWARKAPREDLIAITEWSLWESSPVTFAANAKAAPTKIRSAAFDLHTLRDLLEAVRSGSLGEAQESLLLDIVAAHHQRAGAVPEEHPTPEPVQAPDASSFLYLELLERADTLGVRS